jgi:hypothetical protein
MSDNPDSSPPSARDPRSRPQYGELAPEGWTWKPPQEEARVDVAPAQTARPGAGAAPQASAAPAPSVPVTRTVPRWDRPWTIGLLTFGLLVNLYGVVSLREFPETMQLFYTQQSLGTYTPAAPIATITTVGAITLVFIWLVATALCVRLLMRRRRAFYVPLIGGAISLVALFAFTMAGLFIDPTLIEFLSRQ